MPRKGSISGKELEDQLARDPEHQEKMRSFLASQERRREEEMKQIAPLLAELQTVLGVATTPWALANSHSEYPEALPVLLEHLHRPYPSEQRYAMVRALGKPWARKYVWSHLIDAYRMEPNEVQGEQTWNRVKDALADEIATLSKREDQDVIIKLLMDVNNGRSRLLLLNGLSKSPTARVDEVLHRLATDPDLANEIAARLRRRARRRVKTGPVERPN